MVVTHFNPLALEMRGLSKSFGSCVANKSVNLKLQFGSIHGLVGENGAGKSTCMKMAYGLLQPDAGDLLVQGETRHWRSPIDAMRAGIGMVHQHFMLVDEYTALDNIILGAEPTQQKGLSHLTGFIPGCAVIDRAQARQHLQAIAKQYDLPVPLDVAVGRLPLGMQQRVEILKLLYRSAKILILDEPTAVLTPLETQVLFQNLRRLRDEGCAVLIVTHKLHEVLDLCDTITVLRAGETVATMPAGEVDAAQLARLMVGKAVSLHLEVPAATKPGPVILSMQNISLSGTTRLENICLSLHAGEILGIAGVEGNGQSELLSVILQPSSHKRQLTGKLRIFDRDALPSSPRQIRQMGVGVIPADRQRQGLVLEFSAAENCILGHERRASVSHYGILSRRAIQKMAREIFSDLCIRPANVDLAARGFSGGNQQKIIIGRELSAQPGLLLAAHPTRGVDVGAIELIHQRLVQARDAGAGILLISSDLDEVMSLSDRILVLCGGKIVAEFAKGSGENSSASKDSAAGKNSAAGKERPTKDNLGLAMGGAI